MKLIILAFLVPFLCACQSMTSTTAYPGLNYGDSLEKVLSVVGKKDHIVEKTNSSVVAFGVWDLLGDCRKKIFTIYEGQGLQQVSYDPAPEMSLENECKPSNL